MFSNIADGMVGLFLFLGHWLSPVSDNGNIKIFDALEKNGRYIIECSIKIGWNEEMSDFIDAGIPLRYNIFYYSDIGDSLSFIRTLSCNIVNYTYIYTDSLIINGKIKKETFRSNTYRQIYKAVRKYSHWSTSFNKDATHIHIEATLLPSRVTKLNRYIDLSEVSGTSFFVRDVYKREN